MKRNTKQTTGRKLKKQRSRIRQVDLSISSAGQLVLPRTAKKRRRRNNRKFTFPTAALKAIVTSARWLSLAVLSVAVYALVFVGTNPNFYLTRLPVEGVYAIQPEEIVNMSGLAGRHIFSADPEKAALAIAETPGVLSAEVTLEWPNNVSIKIVEDTPVAVWEQGGTPYWVNGYGQLMPARLNVPGMLRIQTDSTLGVVGMDIPTPEFVEDESGEITEVAQEPISYGAIPEDVLSGALQLQELKPGLNTFTYRPSQGLSYTDTRGWDVYLGTGQDMQQKLAVYEAITNQLLEQGLTPTYISVSNQTKPYYLASASQ